MNTLKGVFPEPPSTSAPRRNFIRENMLHIKKMQGFIVNDSGDHISYRKASKQLENDATQKTMKLIRTTKKQLQNLSQLTNLDRDKDRPTTTTKNKRMFNIDLNKSAVESYKDLERRKFKEIGVQTDKTVHDMGSSRYASTSPHRSPPSEIRVIKSPRSPPPRNQGDGDFKARRRADYPAGVEYEKKDYVKENAQIRPLNKLSSSFDPMKPPSTYQKGVVPKYLRERKEELYKTNQSQGGDEMCPDGHVVLPENERKETLRMLRLSYSELVCELNQLPVRSDTLKIRNRKIEIENQLKKLDEGIRVFTRPKVYVKIGA